jgi:hypothetical protein
MTITTAPAVHCTRCGRVLRSEASRALGLGPVCARRQAAEDTYKAAQVEKAHEVLDDHGIAATPIRTTKGRRVYVVVSSNGADRYFSTITACTCPAGLKGRRCYHQLAARLAA